MSAVLSELSFNVKRLFQHSLTSLDRRDASLARLELFESLLLTNLGRQLGEFTESDAERLYFEVFSPFFLHLWPGDQANPTATYVEHSEESKDLIRAFRPFIVTIEKGMRGEDFFAQQIEINEPPRLLPYYRRVLLLQVKMTKDKGFHSFLKLLRFAKREEWDRLMQESPRPEDVAGAGQAEHSSAAVILYGFLTLWSDWSKLQDCLNEAISDLQSSSDVIRFSERVRYIVNWRVDLSSNELVSRLDTLKEQVKKLVASEYSGADRVRVQDMFDRLFEEIFGLTPA